VYRTRVWRKEVLDQEDFPVERVSDYLAERNTLVWADLTAPDVAEMQQIADELGLDPLVDVQLQDYRDVDGEYDAIVSIEMIEAVGEERLTGVRVKDSVTGAERIIDANGLFYAIGHVPNTAFLEGQLTLDDTGYLITEPRSTVTSIDGVFAAGDVQDKIYRQAITAAGTGCMAALEAERWLSHHTSESKL